MEFQLLIAISLLTICLISIGISLWVLLKRSKHKVIDKKPFTSYVPPKVTQYDIFGGEQEVKIDKDKKWMDKNDNKPI